MSHCSTLPQGPFLPTWESLQNYEIPQWYQDAKFGIFVHWGLYAVAAYGNEWYARNMYQQGTPEFEHHVATYGPQSRFGYKDLIRQFTAEKFDPDEWAGLFRQAGARFVVPVAEHWWFYDGGMQFDSDVQDPRYAGLYAPAQPRTTEPHEAFLDDWLARTCELVDKYEPQLVWFDWWIEQPAFAPYLGRFAAYYYNRGIEWQRGVAINFKHSAFPEGTAVYDVERGQLTDIRPDFWQTDTSISKNSWGYVTEQDYKTATSLIHDLVDIVSKNGALLLNIGPRPDGTIPEQEQEILLEMGRWLALHGEAIYATRPWRVYGEGPTDVVGGSFADTKRQAFSPRDIRFTTRGDLLYAIVLGWPEGDEIVIQSLGTQLKLYAGAIGTVEMLGVPEPLAWSQGVRGLRVRLPAERPSEHAVVLRITPKREA